MKQHYALLLCLLLAACLGTSEPTAAPGAGGDTPAPTPAASPAPPQAPSVPSIGTKGLTTMSAQDAKTLLSRVPELKQEADDQSDFKMREKSMPAPKTAQKVSLPFPAPEAPPAAPKPEPKPGPLVVLRYAPEGEISFGTEISVTFSQPMVPISALEQVEAKEIPITITPALKGKWRWAGTQTLQFKADPHIPMASEYAVKIPAGTKSEVGGVLEKEVSFKLGTPSPEVSYVTPYSGEITSQEPKFTVYFNQEIKPQDVFSKISLTSNGQTIPIQLESDEALKARLGDTQKKALGFAAKDKLAVNSPFTIKVDAGFPSAEGPRKSKNAYTSNFRTYGPLAFIKAQCNWGGECTPQGSFAFEFNNSLAYDSFDPQLVTISPEIPNANIYVSGNYLYIEYNAKGRTTYKVNISKNLKDVYGQSLGKEVSAKFTTTQAYPMLSSPKQGFVVLDPSGGTNYSIFTINHKAVNVSLYQVSTDNWKDYIKYSQNYYYGYGYGDSKLTPPGKLISTKKVDIDMKQDELVETRIDLSPALKGKYGSVFLLVEQIEKPKNNEYWNYQHLYAWVQVTKLGIDVAVDGEEVLAWASSLQNGAPEKDVELTLLPSKDTAKSDAQGIAKLPLTKSAGMIVAKKGDDIAFLPSSFYDYDGWYPSSPYNEVRWYVFDDRHLYRPGEEVKVKGWLRTIEQKKKGDVRSAPVEIKTVNYQLYDSRGNEIKKGTAQLDGLGGFDFSVKLPGTVNLGNSYISLSLPELKSASGANYSHYFDIQEFRRPEFEVNAEVLSKGPFYLGDKVDVQATAKYYAGGPLPSADVTWTVTGTPTSYTPPNRDEFTFGRFTPWWEYRYGYDEYGYGGYEASISQNYTGKTDASGAIKQQIAFENQPAAKPLSVSVEAAVQDVNRQTWSANTQYMIHPASYYVGLRSERFFVQKGEKIPVEAILVDIDGKAIAKKSIEIKAVRKDWTLEKGKWINKEFDPITCSLSSGELPSKCEIATKEGGTYTITATAKDDKERAIESEITVWVAGGKQMPSRNVEEQQVTLIPGKKEYKPGETVELLVLAPFENAEGVLTLRRNGVVRTDRFTIKGTSHTLKFTAEDSYTPNVYAQVNVIGSAMRVNDKGEPEPKLPKQPAYGVGQLEIKIPPYARTLNVAVTPTAKEVEPGAEVNIDLLIKDATGQPLKNAEAAVVVVDEAVLALSGYSLPDPLTTFYSARGADTSDAHLRSHVMLAGADDVKMQAAAQPVPTESAADEAEMPMKKSMAAPSPVAAPAAEAFASGAGPGGGGYGAGLAAPPPPPISLRKDFNALALFAARLPTNGQGIATVKFKVPDNLTRYRIMAVAVEGENKFGRGESTLTARLPLMVRQSPPRFLNFGDSFELPVVLQNQTNKAMEVSVALRATNTSLKDGIGYKVTVPANDRLEVRFPMSTEKPGTARFQVVAASGNFGDASEFSLPVYTPATTEAFATYGVIDQGAIAQVVQAPKNVYTAFGGLEISTSSTAVSALTDAFIYIYKYPYGCAEQVASRLLSVATLRDVLTAFQTADLPESKEIMAAMDRDVLRLQSLQNRDGGFGFWYYGEESWPYLTIHVAHALSRAQDKGVTIPNTMTKAVLTYMQNIDSHIAYWYSKESRLAIKAYALYARHRLKNSDPVLARKLIAEAGGVDKLSLEAVGWLMPTLAQDAAKSKTELEAIQKLLMSRVSETAGAANFTTSYSDGDYVLLHSERRVDGILLEGLIYAEPKSDLIPKLVTGLLAHRTKGRWGNTQENAFILAALDLYFNTYEKVTPNFVARVWLGDDYAGSVDFKGRDTNSYEIDVPMASVVKGKEKKDLILSKEGEGRLYYRVGMQYAPNDLNLKAADYGFKVERSYSGVDKADDVKRDKDGTWRVKAGTRVRVSVKMKAPSRRYHVALVDPLPAGLEIQNDNLLGTAANPPDLSKDKQAWYWWWSRWYQHENLRDERAEAFTTLLWEGEYNYSYVTRATTPGSFVVPPSKAEEMYSPEVFGRSASDKLVVE